ncbi:glycosyltransferase family A protein [Flavobacterium branchiophilum]|uniref:Glycosyl transferase, group 2 family protein n=1 Tax=Flavobacterium branchiophilum (strain FL-15) TaxID=1034807 RepID=G2Z6M9_FLABF|nr:glycosyltransferase family A protein [Flavobacterium branchiophilum]CCB68871.1 Glycosyl transferase, group 2 family protein [Flavobacterium branchiophilum FL-15]
MKQLAIIIPYYNKKYFGETLQSLANQIDKRFVVYIGNDNSPNDPLDVLQQYEGQFDMVYQKFETNLGGTSLTQQWDRCIALCQNEPWLMILGDDDVLGHNVVAAFYAHVNEIVSQNLHVIRFASVLFNEKDQSESKTYTHQKQDNTRALYFKKIKHQSRSSLSEHIFSNKAYQQFGFKNYPLAWHSDDMAWLEFSNFADLYGINEAIVRVRMSHDNISGQRSNLRQKELASFEFYQDLIEKYWSKFNENEKKMLLQQFEFKTMAVHQKKINTFVKISKLYLSKGYFEQLLRFLIRFLIKY